MAMLDPSAPGCVREGSGPDMSIYRTFQGLRASSYLVTGIILSNKLIVRIYVVLTWWSESKEIPDQLLDHLLSGVKGTSLTWSGEWIGTGAGRGREQHQGSLPSRKGTCRTRAIWRSQRGFREGTKAGTWRQGCNTWTKSNCSTGERVIWEAESNVQGPLQGSQNSSHKCAHTLVFKVVAMASSSV